MIRLVFMNADARPKNEAIECSADSVPAIMCWYGSHCAGDRYVVAANGKNVPMDDNGEPTNWPEIAAQIEREALE